MALASFFVTLLTFIAIYSLFGIGLNIKFGFTGLIDFGHVAYFMIGAYVAVVLTMPAGGGINYAGLDGLALPATLGSMVPFGGLIGWLLGVLGGMIAAALASLLVGIPALRLREDYLAITALGIATVLNAVINNEQWLFNGPFGIRAVHQPLNGLFPLSAGTFTLNLAVLGGVSVLTFGYGAYRVGQIVNNVSRRSALFVTAGVGTLVGGFLLLLRGGAFILGALGLFAVTAVLARAVFRRTATYLAAMTLVLTEVFVIWYFLFPAVTGDIAGLLRNVVWLFSPDAGSAGGLSYDRFLLILAAVFLLGGYWLTQRTINSPYGRVLRAIREDENVPEALGRSTYRYKIQSLMLGSALAGAAGSLWAVKIGFIDPTQFADTVTFFAFSAVIIGGKANNRGVILGTAIFWGINSGTRFLTESVPTEFSVQVAAARLILLGSLLIIILYYRSEGLLGEQSYPVSLPETETDTETEASKKGAAADD